MTRAFVLRPRDPAPAFRTEVVVARGSLGRAAEAIAARWPDRLLVVVSDARVARLHARAFARRLAGGGRRVVLLTVPAGERSKTRETKARLEDSLAGSGAGRDTLIVAVGGGVTGDLAGFLAATWHRGVPVVQIPTTLLAMVDAGLGGKTGVDVPAGKNLIGAFHQPAVLWADTDLLATLPDRDFRCGLAEAVKTAAALDAALFRDLERDAGRLVRRQGPAVEEVVHRCLRLKARVVARDPFDAGPRAALNFGHTIAHAVEAASGWRIPHGEAVAIGVAAESRLAVRRIGLPASDALRIEALLQRLGLPTRAPRGLDRRAVARHARADKKTRGGVVRCALPVRLGRFPPGPDLTVPVAIRRDLIGALFAV